MEREMTAPMSLEGREAPVFGGVREKERERVASGFLVGVEK